MKTSSAPETRARPFAAAQQRLIAAGLRPTRPRLQLARLLFAHRDRHVTAEMLAQEAVAAGLKCASATVYNVLNAFARAGLVREVAVDGTRTWFDTNTGTHHHFVGPDGRPTDIEAGLVEIGRVPEAPPGHRIAAVEIIVRLARDA